MTALSGESSELALPTLSPFEKKKKEKKEQGKERK
jgi:hypothetical protein